MQRIFGRRSTIGRGPPIVLANAPATSAVMKPWLTLSNANEVPGCSAAGCPSLPSGRAPCR
jgi:hypothetical protein